MENTDFADKPLNGTYSYVGETYAEILRTRRYLQQWISLMLAGLCGIILLVMVVKAGWKKFCSRKPEVKVMENSESKLRFCEEKTDKITTKSNPQEKHATIV